MRTTGDPLAELERMLVAAAGERSAPERRRLRWAPAVAAALAVAAVVVAALLDGGAGTQAPSLAQAAYAQLDPAGGIVVLGYDSRTLNAGRLTQHARAEVAYGATRERGVFTSLGPRTGRTAGTLEVARTPREIRSYESRSNTLTVQSTCRRSRPFARATTIDPVARFDDLYRRGRLTPRGTTTFGGRRVARLVAHDAGEEIVFLVAPGTAAPIAMTVRPLALRATPFTGTVVRFLHHERLPFDAARLTLRPHPGAKVIRLGRSRC